MTLLKLDFIKGKEVIPDGKAKDKSRGIQLIGPGGLQLSPIHMRRRL